MEKYLYGKGWLIRSVGTNAYKEHYVLKIRNDGSFNFVNPYSKGAEESWVRFLTKAAADKFANEQLEGKFNFPYEIVEAPRNRYMIQVKDELYKTVWEQDKDLVTFGIDKVKYLNVDGSVQTFVPAPLLRTPATILKYLFKDVFREITSEGNPATVAFKSYTSSGSKPLWCDIVGFIRNYDQGIYASCNVELYNSISKQLIVRRDGAEILQAIRTLPAYKWFDRPDVLFVRKTQSSNGIRLEIGQQNSRTPLWLLATVVYPAIAKEENLPGDYTVLSDKQLGALRAKMLTPANKEKVKNIIIDFFKKDFLDDCIEHICKLADELAEELVDMTSLEIFESADSSDLFTKIYNDNYGKE